jgi:hypothetical protein
MQTRINHPESGTDPSHYVVYLISALFLAGGLMGIFGSLYLEEKLEDSIRSAERAHNESLNARGSANTESSTTTANTQSVAASSDHASDGTGVATWLHRHARLISKMLGEIGLALISIGGIALLLEVPVMSNYFQTKIARTMTKQEYLKRLKKEQLETLQVDSLKAYWELEEIDREGLYDYCKNQVQGFIAKPYRENVLGIYTVKSANGKPHEVEESLSYTCRAIRGNIQSEVKWSTRKGEVDDRDVKFKVTLEIPDDIWNEPEFQKKHPGVKRVVEFDKEDIKSEEEILETTLASLWNSLTDRNKKPTRLTKLVDLDRVGYELSLEAYADVDKLHVGLEITYKAPVGRSLTWQMSHPSKNVTGVVIFEGLSFYLETFGVTEQYLHAKNKSPEDSPQKFEYNSWLLPESGFVFHLLPRPGSNSAAPQMGVQAR